VDVRGTLAGQRFQAAYAPTLPFTLTALELSPVLPARAAGAVPSPTASAAAFHRVADGSVRSTRQATADVGPGRLRLPVPVARVIALIALPRRCSGSAPQPSSSAVAHSTLGRHGDLVQVKSMEALALLAERYESLIIHEQTDLGHAYLVADTGTLYAYLVPARGSERELRELFTAEAEPRPVTAPPTARGLTRTIPA
jgi:hypothetical protein